MISKSLFKHLFLLAEARIASRQPTREEKRKAQREERKFLRRRKETLRKARKTAIVY